MAEPEVLKFFLETLAATCKNRSLFLQFVIRNQTFVALIDPGATRSYFGRKVGALLDVYLKPGCGDLLAASRIQHL